LIYPVKTCNVDQSVPSCERTRVSVLRPVEGQMTFIGKLEGEGRGETAVVQGRGRVSRKEVPGGGVDSREISPP
jgi:hypothetical protein